MQKHFENNTIRLLCLLLFLSALSVLAASLNAMVFLLVFILVVAIFILFKYRASLNKSDLIVGACFAVLCVPSNFLLAIFVFPAYIASVSIFKANHTRFFIVCNHQKYDILKTCICIFVVGGILAGTNVLLALSSNPLHITFQINWLFDALRAGILEEICFRMFFFAICILITKNAELSKKQSVLCYAIMILPHVLLHVTHGVDFGSIIILALLYGLPFAMMQRRQNLVAAIGAHSLVDLVRFVLLGI